MELSRGCSTCACMHRASEDRVRSPSPEARAPGIQRFWSPRGTRTGMAPRKRSAPVADAPEPSSGKARTKKLRSSPASTAGGGKRVVAPKHASLKTKEVANEIGLMFNAKAVCEKVLMDKGGLAEGKWAALHPSGAVIYGDDIDDLRSQMTTTRHGQRSYIIIHTPKPSTTSSP
ncbi:Uncharacterized protein PBTT_04378 [Plasmodiophora brassicae]